MDIERLKELREEVFEDYKAYMVKNLKDEDGKVYPSTVPLDECSPIGKDLLKLIDEAIARQSVKSEEVQREINRLTDALKQTKEAAKELKEQKYAVNMLPVYDQIKSLELQIAALQAYQPWVGDDQ